MFKPTTSTPAREALRSGEFVSRFGLAALIAVVLALAVPTGLVALMQGGGALKLPFNLFVVDQRLPWIFRLHMLASGLSLLLIPLVIAVRRDRSWHRPLGRAAAVAVVVGGLTALPVAVMSESVLAARLGFFAQGVMWLALLATGVTAIRNRRLDLHRRCMLAMAGVASGAIWVRMTTTVATAWDLPFDPMYSCAAWFGWIVPMALAWRYGPMLASAQGRRASGVAPAIART